MIYPNPGFPIYESQIVANGAKPVPIHLHESRNFSFDPAELERLITTKTKLLILNYPHNPTGGCLTRHGAGADRRDPAESIPQVWVYADEIYSRLVFEGEFFSIAQVPGMYERTIISDGASKTWAMTGWRIGFTSNPALAPRVHALDHQHRVVRLADQPVGRGRGDHRAAGRGGGDEEELPRAPRPDRRPAERGARA